MIRRSKKIASTKETFTHPPLTGQFLLVPLKRFLEGTSAGDKFSKANYLHSRRQSAAHIRSDRNVAICTKLGVARSHLHYY